MKTKWILKCFNFAAIALIVASVFVLLRVVLTPAGQVPQVLGISVFRVMTGSMEPEFPRDALLVVRKTEPQNLQPGDVISFFSADPSLDGAVNTHRIVCVEEQTGQRWFYTRGDANQMEDIYPVREDMLIGKVIFSSGVLGAVVHLLSNPLVFGGLILLPLLVILLGNLYRAVRIAVDIAKKEEEEAVRQALEGLKAQQQSGEEKKKPNASSGAEE